MEIMGRSLRSLRPGRADDVLKILDGRMESRHRGREHRLIRGDSVEVLAQFPESCVDLIFADPPYLLSNGGSTCQSGRRVSVDKASWDASAGLASDHEWNRRWLEACRRVLKPSGTIWVSGTQHVIFSIGFAMQQLGFHLLNTITWFKPNASPNLACRFFTHSTEIVLWAAPARQKPLPHTFHYREMKAENGGKQMRDLWELPEPDGNQVIWSLPTPPKSEKKLGRHPTQKPRALLDRIVRAGSSPGELVVDPFNGSGTTGVAALATGRRYIGIDLDPKYLDLTQRRIAGE
jgi:site-specific DNA-methyltransferase (adenine-specific)